MGLDIAKTALSKVRVFLGVNLVGQGFDEFKK
jgi:hypothetical protein